MKPTFAQELKNWRRLNYLTQHMLAAKLKVTQQSISAWERGLDEPSARVRSQLRGLMSAASEVNKERAFIRDHSTIRALTDVDGVRLIGYSAGFQKAWPEFCEMEGVYFEEKLMNEIKAVATNAEHRKQILSGEIVIISGTSLQQIDINKGPIFLHDWHVLFRDFGSRLIADVVIEPSKKDARIGIHRILKISDI